MLALRMQQMCYAVLHPLEQKLIPHTPGLQGYQYTQWRAQMLAEVEGRQGCNKKSVCDPSRQHVGGWLLVLSWKVYGAGMACSAALEIVWCTQLLVDIIRLS
mmetsp:Transcript_21565/g.56237  ORF Transcript_21565/g.56237 Transcript_21565/m.56237 type:complete len:102 (-) Transcript_21565:859-1164(-)